jgi:hypothetical protein
VHVKQSVEAAEEYSSDPDHALVGIQLADLEVYILNTLDCGARHNRFDGGHQVQDVWKLVVEER